MMNDFSAFLDKQIATQSHLSQVKLSYNGFRPSARWVDCWACCSFVCLLQDASGHSNVLKAGKAEELKNAIASPTKKYP